MSLLPNFCQGRGSNHLNQFNDNMSRGKGRRTGGPDNETLYQRYLSERLANESYEDWLLRLYGGYLPGTDPRYALNQSMPPPDGTNNMYSNSGADGRYKDNKSLYMKQFLNSINLSIGILLCITILAKKT
jgi:hypothetical protein